MNVLWTADQYDMQQNDPRGIFNYLSNLSEGLRESPHLALSVLRMSRSPHKLGERDMSYPIPPPSPFFLFLRNSALSFTPLGSHIFRRVDLLHVTTWGASYTPLVLSPRLRGVELVATVHDIGNVLHPDLYRYGALERSALLSSLKQLARSGCSVIAVSESTKQDLIHHIGFPDEKVFVVPEGVDELFKPVEPAAAKEFLRSEYGVEGGYALYVGSAHPRKSLRRLLEAFRYAKKDGLTWELLLVGVEPGVLSGMPAALTDDVRALGYAPRDHLPLFLAACGAFVFPSLYEGFGLPVLEAMACGAPVIASDRSSIPELLGDAGLLVDPLDVERMAEELNRLHRDEGLRRRLGRRAIERARLFTWERAVEGTLEAYERCLT